VYLRKGSIRFLVGSYGSPSQFSSPPAPVVLFAILLGLIGHGIVVCGACGVWPTVPLSQTAVTKLVIVLDNYANNLVKNKEIWL